MRAAAASAAPQGSTATHIDVSDTETASGTHWRFLTETEWQLSLDPEWTPPEEDSFNTLGRGYFLIEDGAELTVSGVTHANTIYIEDGANVRLTFLDTEITWPEPSYIRGDWLEGGSDSVVGYELLGIEDGKAEPLECLRVGAGAHAVLEATEGATVTLEGECSGKNAGAVNLQDDAILDFEGAGAWNITGYAINAFGSYLCGTVIGSTDSGARYKELNFNSGTFNVEMRVEGDDDVSGIANAMIGGGTRSGGFDRVYFGNGCDMRCTYYYNTADGWDLIPFFVGVCFESSNDVEDSAIVFDGATFIGRVESGPETNQGEIHTYATIGKSVMCSAGVSVEVRGDSVIDIDGGIGNSSDQVVAWNEYVPCTVHISGGLVMCKGSLSPGIGADYLTISGENTCVYATTEQGGSNAPPAVGGWNEGADAVVDIRITSGASVMAMTAGSGVAIGGTSTKTNGITIEISGDDTTVMAVSNGQNAAIGSAIMASYTTLRYDTEEKPLVFASSIKAMEPGGAREFGVDDYAYVFGGGDVRLVASIIDLRDYPADGSGLERILGGDIYMLKDISLGDGAALYTPKYWNLHQMEHDVNGDSVYIDGKITKLTTDPPTYNYGNSRLSPVSYGSSPGEIAVDTATVTPDEELSFEWFEDDDGDPLTGSQTSTGVTTKRYRLPTDLSVGTHYFFAKVRGSGTVPRVVELSTPCFVVRVVGSAPQVTERPVGLKVGYTGEAVALVRAGAVEGGTFVYSLGDPAGPYTETIPEATEKGSYWVYYKVNGDDYHIDDPQVKALKAEIVDIAFSTPETLPDAIVNNPYAGVEIKGTGLGNLTVKVVAGSLPEGMVYDAASGVLYGTPLKSGSYTLTLQLDSDRPGVKPVEGDFRLRVDALTFSFYGNGGSYEETDKLDLPYTGAVFETPALVRDGHALRGFSDRPEKTDLITDFTSYSADMDFFAVWEKDGSGSDSASGGASDSKSEYVLITGGSDMFRYKASGKGNSLQLTARVLPLRAVERNVTWRSSNTKLATVDGNGIVTFKGPEGIVKITATTRDGTGRYGTRAIKVCKNVTKMRTSVRKVYTERKVYLRKGKSLTLPVVMYDKTAPLLTVKSKLTWRSSKPKVAVVDSKGRVKASGKVRKMTRVVVVATAYNGMKLKFTVYVVPKERKLTKARVTWPKKSRVKKGKTYRLRVSYPFRSTGVRVTFKSSKKSVLTVDKAGRIVAKKKGKATVTVKVGKKTYKKKIKVT
jgi:hypothetical protein